MEITRDSRIEGEHLRVQNTIVGLSREEYVVHDVCVHKKHKKQNVITVVSSKEEDRVVHDICMRFILQGNKINVIDARIDKTEKLDAVGTLPSRLEREYSWDSDDCVEITTIERKVEHVREDIEAAINESDTPVVVILVSDWSTSVTNGHEKMLGYLDYVQAARLSDEIVAFDNFSSLQPRGIYSLEADGKNISYYDDSILDNVDRKKGLVISPEKLVYSD